MSLQTKDYLSDVLGLKNDIVFKVFSCPDCGTDVTISRYQVLGQLPILCARCNHRYQVSGETLLTPAPMAAYQPETFQDGKATAHGDAYKVYAGLDATQKAAPVPKDSFLLVMKPELAPKPAPAPAAPPKPAA